MRIINAISRRRDDDGSIAIYFFFSPVKLEGALCIFARAHTHRKNANYKCMLFAEIFGIEIYFN